MSQRNNIVCHRKGEYRDKSPSTGATASQSCECIKSCGKIYLELTPSSKIPFVGCQPIEDFLVGLGLVRYAVEESLHKSANATFALTNEVVGEDDSGPTAELSHFRGDQDNNLDFHHLIERGKVSFKTYRRSTLKRHDIDKRDPNLLKKQAMHYYLEVFFRRFKDHLRSKCSKSPRYEELLAELTPKQRVVMDQYIVGPLSSETMKVAAQKLKMNIHTFRDHLDATKKKIFKIYPEKQIRRTVNAYKRDLFYGFWRESEHQKIHPVKYTIGATGEVTEYSLKEGNPFKNRTGTKLGLKLNWQRPQNDQDKYVLAPRFTLESWNLEENERNYKSEDELFDKKG